MGRDGAERNATERRGMGRIQDGMGHKRRKEYNGTGLKGNQIGTEREGAEWNGTAGIGMERNDNERNRTECNGK